MTLETVVSKIAELYSIYIAKPNDVVLLAPACASLDQYENYAARGRDFVDAVKGIE